MQPEQATDQVKKICETLSNKEINSICTILRALIKANSDPRELLMPSAFLVKKLMLLEETLYEGLEAKLSRKGN